MGIVRGTLVIGVVTAAAFLNLPAHAENDSKSQESKPKTSEKAAEGKATKGKLVSAEIVAKTGPEKKQPLFRHASYPDAWTASQKSNRPILLYVSMRGCHHCDKMMAESYREPEMEKMITDSFEPVYVTRKSNPKLVKSLKVRWYPTTILVGPNNKVMDMIEGYVDKKTFRRRLQTGLAAGNTEVKTR